MSSAYKSRFAGGVFIEPIPVNFKKWWCIYGGSGRNSRATSWYIMCSAYKSRYARRVFIEPIPVIFKNRKHRQSGSADLIVPPPEILVPPPGISCDPLTKPDLRVEFLLNQYLLTSKSGGIPMEGAAKFVVPPSGVSCDALTKPDLREKFSRN
uniref:Uncharacterized protein n=1 Tax=Vespula pensylvanica TaxID=30213 RepID=A0A834K4W8_VESPE|nr:hypothetical protein H0235_015853 [Vespula pensylvanica]